MGRLVKGLALSAIASSVVMAGGYKLPEQSLNSMALAAAYVAHTTGADAAYYNPANMSFMGEKQYIEGGISLVHLPSNVYTSVGGLSGESEEENLLVPNIHYVSAPMGNFRWGASLVVPGGLTKRWETPYQKASAEEFTLEVIEFSPTLSYKVSDDLSVAGGIRIVYTDGIVKSNGADFSAGTGVPQYNVAREMEGDDIAFGYNLALTYKPTPDINFAVTYRSNVDLDVEGTAKLSAGGQTIYNGKASVSVPLPAALNIAVSKTWENKYTLEFDYERAFWSEYDELDFEYGGANIGPLTPAFDDPKARDWNDVDIFRIGGTVKVNNQLTAMMGFSIDNSPAPVETLGFELPDSDSKNYSIGFRYQQTESISWGAAFLWSDKDTITVAPGTDINPTPVSAEFSDGGAFLTTLGVAYEF